MADSPENPLSTYVDAPDLVFIDDLLLCGYHLIQSHSEPGICYLQEAPQFCLFIQPGEPLLWWYEKELLTKEVWFDRLIERAYERQARLIERALNDD